MKILLLPQNLSGKRSKSQVQDIYSKPLIDAFGEEMFLFPRSLRDIADAKRLPSKMLVIGNIPSYIIGREALVDGFVHLVVDKYIFQNIAIAAPKSKLLKNLLIKSIYGRCKPSNVVVNNQEMKADFEEAFCEMGLEVNVHVAPHPVTAHNLSIYESAIALRKKINTENSSMYLLSDSGYLYELRGVQHVFERPLKDFVKFLPYNISKDLIVRAMSRGDFVGLFNFRKNGVFFTGSWRKFFSKDYWHPFFLTIKKQKRLSILRLALHDIVEFFIGNNYQTLNARWKPSTKLSTAIALALPLVSEAEASLVEFSGILEYPVYFYDSILSFEKSYTTIVENRLLLNADIEINREASIALINDTYISVFQDFFLDAST